MQHLNVSENSLKCWLVWISNTISEDVAKKHFGLYYHSSFLCNKHRIVGLHNCPHQFLINLKNNGPFVDIKFCQDTTVPIP